MKTTKVLFAAATLLMACGTPTEEEGAVQPNLSGGKADGQGITVREGLDFDANASGEFKSDLQFDAYEFLAKENAEITLEITQRGSSRGLDTTMFLFGPKENGEYPDDAIVYDNDDGWGKLSKVDDFRLYNEGVYMVVIGTKNGFGRGQYNLDLTCESENCKPQVGPDITECDGFVVDYITECMNWVSVESDYDDPEDAPTNAELLDDCIESPGSYAAEDWFLTEGSVAGACDAEGCAETDPGAMYYHAVCDNHDRDWCNAGLDAFRQNMIPSCREDFTIPEIGDLNLTDVELNSDAINALYSKFDTTCGEYCYIYVLAFSYDTELPPMRALATQMALQNGNEFYAGTTYYDSSTESLLSATEFAEAREEMVEVANSIGIDLNEALPTGAAAWSGVPYPSVDVSSDGFTVVDEASKQILFVEMSSASE